MCGGLFSYAHAGGRSQVCTASASSPAALAPGTRNRLLGVAVIGFLDLLSYSLVFPLLPFFAAQFAATPTQTGLLIGSFALAQMISAPVLGRVSDVYGRKPVLLLTTGGTVVGFCIMGLANSLLLLFIARLLDGATGGNTTAAQSYVSDLTEPGPGRTQAFAWLAVAGSLGFVCGPVLGGMLAQTAWGLKASAFAAMAIGITNWLAIALLLPESLTPQERAQRRAAASAAAAEAAAAAAAREAAAMAAGARRSLLRQWVPAAVLDSPRVMLLLFLRVAWSVPFNALFTTFSLFLSLKFGLVTSETGRVLAYAGALQIAVQACVVGPLTRRLSENTLLLIALATGGACLGSLAITQSLPLLLVIMVPTAAASAIFGTVVSSALSAAAAPGQTGTLLGISFSVEAATRVVAPVLAGALMTWAGPQAPGLCGAAIVALSMPVALSVIKAQGGRAFAFREAPRKDVLPEVAA